MDQKREAVGRQIKQIEALEKDGTLSAAQAADEKKAVIARFMDEVVEEPMPSPGGSKGASFLTAGFGYVRGNWARCLILSANNVRCLTRRHHHRRRRRCGLRRPCTGPAGPP